MEVKEDDQSVSRMGPESDSRISRRGGEEEQRTASEYDKDTASSGRLYTLTLKTFSSS